MVGSTGEANLVKLIPEPISNIDVVSKPGFGVTPPALRLRENSGSG